MFGTLISPKLRAAQLSFETALETTCRNSKHAISNAILL
ncbi:hypothetical protein NC652_015010 [Populus alba x Populus x berolinensis]|nr:hypothetical protein NC652_015010 [Populus alba x Populus x berolinensis]